MLSIKSIRHVIHYYHLRIITKWEYFDIHEGP